MPQIYETFSTIAKKTAIFSGKTAIFWKKTAVFEAENDGLSSPHLGSQGSWVHREPYSRENFFRLVHH